jgi:hypothetical protein
MKNAAATRWCDECQDHRTGTHGNHPGYDSDAHEYAREMHRRGIHPSQDRD